MCYKYSIGNWFTGYIDIHFYSWLVLLIGLCLSVLAVGTVEPSEVEGR